MIIGPDSGCDLFRDSAPDPRSSGLVLLEHTQAGADLGESFLIMVLSRVRRPHFLFETVICVPTFAFSLGRGGGGGGAAAAEAPPGMDPRGMDLAAKMMQKMGWRGGGLGREQQVG